jgi:YD repeat-containing protein
LHYKQDFVLESREVWEYDNSGRLKKKVHYSGIDGKDTISARIFIYQTIENQLDTGEIEAKNTKAIIHKYICDLNGNISESRVMRRDGSVAELSVFRTDSITGTTEEERKWYNTDGAIQHHWTLKFDAKGNQLEKGYWNSKGEFVPLETAQYDENNNVIEKVYYSYYIPSRTTKSIIRRYYNEVGKITELHRFDTRWDSIRPYGKEIYNYNSDGNIEKITTLDRNDTIINQTVYKYDNENKLLQINQNNFRISPIHHRAYHSTITAYRYDSLGNLTHQVLYHNGTQVSEMIFGYDAMGNIIIEKEYNNGILKSETINKYDDSGRITETTQFHYLGKELDENGMINTISEYRREYDVHGNWTIMDYLGDGKIFRRKIRVIEYYDSVISPK